VQPGLGLEPTPLHGLVTVLAYAERLAVPWPQTFFHRPLAAVGGVPVYPMARVAAGAAVSLAVVGALATALRTDRAAALLLAAFVASLLPLCNFVRTGLPYGTADHLLYLPLLLLASGLARLGHARIVAWSERRDVKLAFGAVLLTYGGIVLVRTLDYQDQTTLFESELALFPDNPVAEMSLGEEAARAGDVERAFSLSLSALAKEGRTYPPLLARATAAKTYLRLLGLQAARTADGSPDELRLLLAEMERLLARKLTGTAVAVGELRLGRAFDERVLASALDDGGEEALSAEAAFVASRLGARETARRLLASLGPEASRHLPSVGNVILAHARILDFDGAMRWLALLPAGADAEQRRLEAARALLARAASAPSLEASVLRAQAYLELGASLLALRELRPAYDRAPAHSVVGPLYVHLLMAARLEQEAARAATRALGEAGARQMLEGIRSQMPPRLLALRRPVEPSSWLASAPVP
jgi:hypothetical protein